MMRRLFAFYKKHWALMTTSLFFVIFTLVVLWARQEEKPVSLRFTLPKMVLKVGETVRLQVIAGFEDGSKRNVTEEGLIRYETSDHRLAKIDSTGLLRVLSEPDREGATVDLLASYGDLAVTAKVTLVGRDVSAHETSAKPGEVVGLEVWLPKTTLKEGETVKMLVKAILADGSVRDVTKTSDGTLYKTLAKLVKVDSNGLLKVRSPIGDWQLSESVFIVHQPFGGVIQLTLKGGSKKLLKVIPPKTTLRVGETIQLKVTKKLPDGSTLDVTDSSTGTFYQTTDEFQLIPEPDGRVTCIGTRGKPKESAIIGVTNGELYGSIRFKLLPDGPGPGLEVVAGKVELYEGEQTQLQVLKPLQGGGEEDVSAVSTGTKYRIWDAFDKGDPNEFKIDEKGVISAPQSIGHMNRASAVIFVRNGDKVGWINLKVFPERARK